MATPRKKRTNKVADEGYSKLEEYCIWLNEYYKSLRKAGFNNDNALWLTATKESFPDWFQVDTVPLHLRIIQVFPLLVAQVLKMDNLIVNTQALLMVRIRKLICNKQVRQWRVLLRSKQFLM